MVQARSLGAYRLISIRDTPGRAAVPAPGQFYMLAAAAGWGGGEDERPFLGRAFSVARAHPGPGHDLTLDFLLEEVGPGTARLCELEPPEPVALTGPLGIGFSAPEEGRRAILVGGGVGVAPLAIWQDALEDAGLAQTTLIGFRDAAHAGAGALFAGARVATDDASVGHGGRVTELLASELDRGEAAAVYACGPAPMLEAVRGLCAARDVPAQLAMEAVMACGYGACFGCAVPTREGGYLRVCVEGPVVDARRLAGVHHPGHP